MRHTANISTLIIILIGFSSNLIAQTNDKYRALLNRENQKRLEIYDTIVSLDYLSELRYESLTNMQIFEGFDYPKFNKATKNNQIILSNDSIKIVLETKPFDSIRFVKYYRLDSLKKYYASPYFRNLPIDFEYPPFYPKTEISKIIIKIKNKEIYPQEEVYKNLYDIELTGIDGYVTDNRKILLTLFCGGGAASYITIFIFDRNGKFERRIEESII